MAPDNLEEALWQKLDEVKDPCMQAAGLDLSLVGLGIVRSIESDPGRVRVELGLTEPGCGFTHVLMTQVRDALEPMVGDRTLDVSFNWSDPWTEDRMAPEGRAVFERARKRGVGVLSRLTGQPVAGSRH